MSAIDDYDESRRAAAAVKARERSQRILVDMADQTARAHLPMCKRIDGWSVSRATAKAPLIVRDRKTGVIHAMSMNTDPRKLSPTFAPPLAGD